jgi:hypothetical protein
MSSKRAEEALLDLASPFKLTKRRALQKHPLVVGAIDKFWTILPKNSAGRISKSVYVEFALRLYKIINSDFVYNEAVKTVEEDWLRDSQRQESISYNVFFTSLFELADVWCPQISAAAYSTFLSKIFRRMTYKIRTSSGKTINIPPAIRALSLEDMYLPDYYPEDFVAELKRNRLESYHAESEFSDSDDDAYYVVATLDDTLAWYELSTDSTGPTPVLHAGPYRQPFPLRPDLFTLLPRVVDVLELQSIGVSSSLFGLQHVGELKRPAIDSVASLKAKEELKRAGLLNTPTALSAQTRGAGSFDASVKAKLKGSKYRWLAAKEIEGLLGNPEVKAETPAEQSDGNSSSDSDGEQAQATAPVEVPDEKWAPVPLQYPLIKERAPLGLESMPAKSAALALARFQLKDPDFVDPSAQIFPATSVLFALITRITCTNLVRCTWRPLRPPGRPRRRTRNARTSRLAVSRSRM